MEELTNEIRLTNAYPVTDEVGSNLKPFRFKLTNTCGVGVDYNLNLEVMETENRINAKNIAVKVDENGKSILNNNPSATPTYKESDYTAVESYTTYSGSIDPYDSVMHEIRIWLDASAGNDSQNGSFYSKVVIEARQNQVVRQNLTNVVKVGDYISYIPNSTSYIVNTSMTGYSADQTINPSELNLWRVIAKNDDGTIQCVSEYVGKSICLYGYPGWANTSSTLSSLSKQYMTDGITSGSNSINSTTYNLIKNSLGTAVAKNTTGSACTYWTSEYRNAIAGYKESMVVNTLGEWVAGVWLYRDADPDQYQTACFNYRPMINFVSGLAVSGEGTAADPFAVN